jgi:hypothetical protein
VVQAFRRSQNDQPARRFPLRGLQADTTYEVHSLGEQSVTRIKGRDLLSGGLAVHLAGRPAAATFIYRQSAAPR